MATVIFYEKPGCINNTRQKKLLRAAGHQVDDRNLLTHDWEPQTLARFLQPENRDSWLNRTHPGLKSGDVELDLSQPDKVLAAMCHDPLLIRRPLMEIDGHCLQGFDAELLDQLIGLSVMPDGDIETCPRSQHAIVCK
ncbi:ArsC/Spx/MgsR family protein [Amphritea pacifica]|uniref:Nitrogenase-associated protein n=1 Tax=Amphritea pacifica TaxID=2811233 RepID=A0ABS2WDF7_9GAMM|nr:ArsC/Spx/MgsR family protein [Amphritea pacifica]MBN0989729.1 hypothetical protein [Amphritea pacifica]MBN1007398.1 hypothetical protein [Amphritea pacifica]